MIKHLLLTVLLMTGHSSLADVNSMTFLRNHSVSGAETIRIKQMVHQRLRKQGQDPANYQLEGVTLVARAIIGTGKATLIVGQDQQMKRVKRPKNFVDLLLNNTRSYRTLEWNLVGDAGQANERWQMRFEGIMNIRRMDVHLSSQGRRIRIPMGGEVFRGNNTLFLKRELRALGYRPRDMKLRKVVLVAKSRRGQGTAQLFVGPNAKPIKRVAASQAGLQFQNNRPRSYNRIRWNVNGRTQGPWQIDLRGRIKVKAVILEVR